MPRRRRLSRHAACATIATVLASGLVLSAAIAAPASAKSGSLSTTVPSITTPTTTTTTPSTSTQTGPLTVPTTTTSQSSGGLSRGAELAIFVAAALLIAGIAWIIVTDARGRTPAGDLPDLDRPKGTIAPLDHRLRRSRAKAKRARRARRAGR
jgi:hypothetical protein